MKSSHVVVLGRQDPSILPLAAGWLQHLAAQLPNYMELSVSVASIDPVQPSSVSKQIMAENGIDISNLTVEEVNAGALESASCAWPTKPASSCSLTNRRRIS